MVVLFTTPFAPLLVWRDRMDVLSKCTIVKTIGRAAYGLKAREWSTVGAEVTLSAMVKTQKNRPYSISVKKLYKSP
jgi:hypothetical protein